MISPAALSDLIRTALPDAMVQVRDLTGTADHYNVRIVSNGFAGMAPLDRHRLVYKAVSEAMKDGRLHALEIRADVP